MKHRALVTITALLLACLSACSRVASNDWVELTPENPGSGPTIRISGTVRHLELEGGLFVVRDDRGGQYNPLNLPSEFRVDGMPVEMDARRRTDVGTIGMIGEAVELLRIRRLPDDTASPGASSDEHFTALGQEPGWRLEIVSGKEITFTYDYGEGKVVAPTPAPQTGAATGVRVYDASTSAGSLRIEIEPTACADVMSGKPFPTTVTVILGGRSFRGCGGPSTGG